MADGPEPQAPVGLLARLLSPRVAVMLWRNTVVGSGVFLVGLGVLYVLVQDAGVNEVPAAAIGFVIANSLHYFLGRSWIYRGTERGRITGYALFLINAGVGLAVTTGCYALLLAYTPLNYLVARALVSVIAGLAMFILNAVFNFRRV